MICKLNFSKFCAMDFNCTRNSTFRMSGRFIPGGRSGQTIRFILCLEAETYDYILHQHPTAPRFYAQHPPSVHNSVATGINITEIARRAVDYCGYALHHEELRNLIYLAWAEVDKIFKADATLANTSGVFSLSCRVRIQHHHVYGVFADCPTMIPAADASLGLLEKYEVDRATDCDCDCCICLEPLDGGDGALRMPCSHVFHGGCIKEWLRSSHYCPLCRYEMPTQ